MAAEFIERRIQSNGQTVNFNIDRKQPYIDTTINGKKARVYGTQAQLDEYQNKKPDGTKKNPVGTQTSLPLGDAFLSRALQKPKAKDDINDGKSSIKQPNNVAGGNGLNLKSVLRNPMENFASVATLFTLASLTPQQFNNPSTYRYNDKLFTEGGSFSQGTVNGTEFKTKSAVVFASAGRYDGQRQSTAYGVPEYYVNSFEMTGYVSATEKTGATNQFGFEFEIYEPYSMGIFLESLQNAALFAGYADYIDSPFLLKMDIKGWSETGEVITSIKPKYFVIKITEVKYSVTESGSVYTCSAFPYNNIGFQDTIDTLFYDVSIAPRKNKPATVEELLADPGNPKSLVNILNKNEKELVSQKRYAIPDEYVIEFPEKSADWNLNKQKTENKRATVNPEKPSNKGPRNLPSGSPVERKSFGTNPIGKSSMGFQSSDGGNFTFSDEDYGYDSESGTVFRERMTINPAGRVFNFKQGQKLTETIVQVILSSKYAKDAVLDPNTLTPEGYIKWFRVDVQIEFLKYDYLIADFARRYTFRVVPFFVHSSVFKNPTSPGLGYAQLESKIVKQYDYIYTGQNTEVLGFDIKINNQFYAGVGATAEQFSSSMQSKDTSGIVEQGPKKIKTPEGTASKTPQFLGKTKQKRDPALLSFMKSGVGYEDVERKVAEAFHNAFLRSGDLIEITMEIMGDTYWLVDSGFGGYFANTVNPTDQITEDGTANYEGTDTYIYINFRTPIDIDDAKGVFKFSSRVSPFSGIYKVTKVISKFDDGSWKQDVTAFRMAGQSLEFAENIKTEKTSNLSKQFDGEEQPKGTLYDGPSNRLINAARGGTLV